MTDVYKCDRRPSSIVIKKMKAVTYDTVGRIRYEKKQIIDDDTATQGMTTNFSTDPNRFGGSPT